MDSDNQAESRRELANLLLAKKSEIVDLWVARVTSDPLVAKTDNLTLPQLLHHIPSFLDSIIAKLSETPTTQGAVSAGRQIGSGTVSVSHAFFRGAENYSVRAALREFSCLRAVISEMCFSGGTFNQAHLTIHAALDEAMAEAGNEVARRKLAIQLRFQQSRKSFDTIINHLENYAVFTCDPDGVITSWNRGVERLLGYTELKFVGKHYPFIFLNPESPTAELHRSLEGASAARSVSDERQCCRNDGTSFWATYVCTRIDDQDGDLVGFAILLNDITLRRKAEDVIASNEQRFRTLANSIPQLAWQADSKGWIFWYNQRWYEYTGTTSEAMKGWGWTKVHHPDHVDRVVKKLSASWVSGEPWEDTFPLRSVKGEWRWFLSRAMPVKDDEGNVLSWFGTNTDITWSREVQQKLEVAKDAAEAADRAKSEFLTNMSHEIRTPLGAIIGFAEELREGDLDLKTHQQYADAIIRNGFQLEQIINDILDLAKVEARRLDVDRQPVTIQSLFEDITGTFEVQATKKAVRLICEMSSDVPEIVHSDPYRLRQILVNIVGNAVKFTEQGEVRILVETSIKDGRNFLDISVCDTGRGMSKVEQTDLFAPFTQADASITRRYGGTGLGLALSRELAELLGGSVELIQSTVGKGSTFKIVIPVDQYDAAAYEFKQINPPRSQVASKKGGARLQGLRILVADDIADNRQLVRLLLSKAGAEVTTKCNGLEAVEEVRKQPYSAILMDLQMPVLDGYEATVRLRHEGFNKPIIALTAHAMKGEQAKIIAAGCNAYLTKPINREILYKTILQHVADQGHKVLSQTSPSATL